MAAMNRMSMAQQLNEQMDGESLLDGILEEVANAKSAFSGVGKEVAADSLAQSKTDTAEARAKGLVARKNASNVVKEAFKDPNASYARDIFSLMKADETNNKTELDADREARIIKASSVVPVATDTSRAKAAIDASKNRVVSEQDETYLNTSKLIEKSPLGNMNSTFVEGPFTSADDMPITKRDTEGLMTSTRPRTRPEGLGEDKEPNTFNFSNTNNPATTMSDVYQNIGLAPGQVNPNAEKNLNKMLDNQFTSFMSNLDFDVTINDTIVKPGSTRIPDPKKKIKGTPNSRHFHGDALDISIKDLSTEQLDKLIISAQEAGFKGFGFGDSILHMDLNGGKEAVRTWSYGNKYWGNNKAYPVGDMMTRVRKGLK